MTAHKNKTAPFAKANVYWDRARKSTIRRAKALRTEALVRARRARKELNIDLLASEVRQNAKAQAKKLLHYANSQPYVRRAASKLSKKLENFGWRPAFLKTYRVRAKSARRAPTVSSSSVSA